MPYPGWDAQTQPPLGGSLLRLTSFWSAASVPAVAAGGRREKPTEGMSRAGRRPSVESSSALAGDQGTSTSTLAAVKHDVAAVAVAVAPRPATPSLISIVEDVSQSNRGWIEELKLRNVEERDGEFEYGGDIWESWGAWVACGVSCYEVAA